MVIEGHESISSSGSGTGLVLPSTDLIRKHGNHLKGQASLYLRQHAYNPVDWYPWGERAMERAVREDKPVFLSIGYASCHWCHVMERQVFEDDTVAAFLNRNFINIKVDREERPDLDKVYMDAVLALTGGGGWPMSVFLTPEQKPFFGGTYFPRDQFLSLITRLAEIYRDRRPEIDAQAEKLARHISRELKLRPVDGAIGEEIFKRATEAAKRNFDEIHGGSRTQMKFPMPVSWRYLLHQYRKNGDPELGQMIALTLDQMSSGGLQDHVGGGFHRYATEPTWLVPHFEKMLYDNAMLAGLYLEASTVFNRPDYARVAMDTLDFLTEEMSSQTGGFYASFDADSGGEEGSYYLWTPDEIIAVAGVQDGPLLAGLLGVEPGGNFEGKSILTRRRNPAEVALQSGRDESQVAGLFRKYRTSLKVARARRAAPGLDRKIITSWNGLTLSALALAYRMSGESRYRRAAEGTADFLMKVHSGPTGLLRSSTDGSPGASGILDDYAFLAQGLLDLYQATGELWQLKRALKLIDQAHKKFRHPQAAYYLTAEGQPAPLGRQVEVTDGVRPSGNSAMLSALLTAAELTGNPEWFEQLQSDLSAYSTALRQAGMEMAGWLDVALRLQGPHFQAVVAGDPQSSGTLLLLDEFHRRAPANAVLVSLPALGPSQEATRLMPAVAGKRALKGRPTAFVCRQGACQKPTHDPAEFGRRLLEGWKK